MESCLIVDDDQNILSWYRSGLGDSFEVFTASTAEGAIDLLRSPRNIAVAVIDHNLPGMKGMDLSRVIGSEFPSVNSIILTGVADVALLQAVKNEDSIYRLLTKPCSTEVLKRNIQELLQNKDKRGLERERSRKILSGIVHVLTEIMAAVDPIGLEESKRLRGLSQRAAQRLGLSNSQEIQAAALLHNVGIYSIPTPLLVKVRTMASLNADEKMALARVPLHSAKLLSHIPNADSVEHLVRSLGECLQTSPEQIRWRERSAGVKLLFLLKVLLNHSDQPHNAEEWKSFLEPWGRYMGSELCQAVLEAFVEYSSQSSVSGL